MRRRVSSRTRAAISFFLFVTAITTLVVLPSNTISLAENSQAIIVYDQADVAYIRRLSTYVESLGLNRGIETSLTAKLNAAIAAIERGNDRAATGQLGAFSHEVDDLQGYALTDEQAQHMRHALLILQYQKFAFSALEFPFADPADIERLAAFGIPNWSGAEPHNGIDLVIQTQSSRIISPVKGTIMSIEVAENPYSHPVGQLLMHVLIFVNYDWTVGLTFEPSTVDPLVKAAQMAALRVRVGQVIDVGEYIGDLLAGNLGYPHMHYSLWNAVGQPVCPYEYSSAIAQGIFNSIPVGTESLACCGTDICCASPSCP